MPEINLSNDTASDLTTFNASADLSITKTGSPDPAVVGHHLTYAITVNPAGPTPPFSYGSKTLVVEGGSLYG